MAEHWKTGLKCPWLPSMNDFIKWWTQCWHSCRNPHRHGKLIKYVWSRFVHVHKNIRNNILAKLYAISNKVIIPVLDFLRRAILKLLVEARDGSFH